MSVMLCTSYAQIGLDDANSLKSALDPDREGIRDSAIDSPMLTAWKEKSNSPTKSLTCLG
ncbi:hypothetical protein N7447_010811 [Penicillium robsamsonii]|uniref:uncharacterized protein n=1 Tax=Penicillium robsamsonii TaxID=1792511 RepID=UPI0025472E3D|nr:uncharacterized protein N7447_010811 [Penicillium robsamsonii]KAJ5807355.1 hypothetical protein N7447_010811 [Penicillium robsamsonii]